MNSQSVSAGMAFPHWSLHDKTGRSDNAGNRWLTPKLTNANPSTSIKSGAAQQADSFSPSSAATQAASSHLQVQDVSASLSKSFDLQFQTKEGDTVSIRYSEANVNHQSAVAYDGADGSVSGFQRESSSSSTFQISITGNLNDDEMKSLQDLMQKIEGVGKDFFRGDTKAAFQQAEKMGFDSKQIAGFSMSFNMQQSVKAMSAYQQSTEQSAADSGKLKQAVDFSRLVAHAMEGQTQVLQNFADPAKGYNDLVAGITEALAAQFGNAAEMKQPLDSLQQLLGVFSGLNVDNQSASTLDTQKQEASSANPATSAPVAA